MSETTSPKTPKRHVCAYCGDDMGPWTKFSDKRDACGKLECTQWEREELRAEREEAHEQLDRDMGLI